MPGLKVKCILKKESTGVFSRSRLSLSHKTSCKNTWTKRAGIDCEADNKTDTKTNEGERFRKDEGNTV